MRTRKLAASAAMVMVAAVAATGPAVAGDRSEIGATPRESGANYAVWLNEHPKDAIRVCAYREAWPELTRTAIIEVLMKRGDMGRERARRHWANGYRPVIARYCRGIGF